MSWVILLLHAVLVAGAMLVLPGLRGRVAARWRGAEGPALDQSLQDLRRLWRKETVLPAGASFLFAAAPIAAAALSGVAALLVPSFAPGGAAAPAADLVVIGVLLGAARLAVALAAWDSGSALLAHGAARGMAARLGKAPVWLLAAFAALLLCGSTNLEAAAAAVRDGGAGARLAGGLAGAALFVLALDHPADGGAWSGRLRGLAVLAAELRSVAALGVAAALALPFGMGAAPEAWPVGLACWVLKLGVLALLAAACPVPPRLAAPVAALLALMAVVAAGMQGTA